MGADASASSGRDVGAQLVPEYDASRLWCSDVPGQREECVRARRRSALHRRGRFRDADFAEVAVRLYADYRQKQEVVRPSARQSQSMKALLETLDQDSKKLRPWALPVTERLQGSGLFPRMEGDLEPPPWVRRHAVT